MAAAARLDHNIATVFILKVKRRNESLSSPSLCLKFVKFVSSFPWNGWNHVKRPLNSLDQVLSNPMLDL